MIRERKAVFLDRDGTINVEKHYLYKVEDFEYIAGAVEGLKMLQDAGYLLIIVTNQSGIARGYYKEEDFAALNNWMVQDLEQKGINIAGVYYCPHLPDADVEKYRMECNCRKPKTGLYEQACRDFDIDMSSSIAIGDKIRDCAVCSVYGCRGFLISDSEAPEIIEAVRNGKYPEIKYAENLLQCAEEIKL